MKRMLFVLCLGVCISTLAGCPNPDSTASNAKPTKLETPTKVEADSKTKDAPTKDTQTKSAHRLLESRTAARESAKEPIDPENLAGITREIAVEPDYSGKYRHYYLLVFDEDETKKVWLVFDGKLLYVDCNLNGDLTDDGEAFATNGDDAGEIKDIEFAMPDGEPVTLGYSFPEEPFDEFNVRIRADYRGATFAAWGDHEGEVPDVASASQAPILRINGPLQMGFETSARWAIESLEDDKFEINVGVGTPGLGAGTFMHLKYWRGAIPKSVYPEVEVHFPPAEQGSPAVVARGKLTRRC